MPMIPHIERHFQATATVRDIVIGMADGLTVPFALAAGLSGSIAATNIVVIAGLAEIAAGSIAMGLADGLTVPFALAAGLSGSIAATNIVVIAGLAEIAA